MKLMSFHTFAIFLHTQFKPCAGKIRKEIITKKDISYRLYIYHMNLLGE